MITEADARARLLAHYDAKAKMLKEHVATLEAELAEKIDAADRRFCIVRIKQREADIARTESDAARVRAAAAKAR